MERKKIKRETFPWEQCMRELGKLRRRESASLFTMLDCWYIRRGNRGQGLLHGSSLHTMVPGAKSQPLSQEHHSFFLLMCI